MPLFSFRRELEADAVRQAGTRIDWSAVAEAIARGEQRNAVIGAAVIAPAGEQFNHNGSRRFVAASTVKVPLMIALFREIEAGRQRLDAPYVLGEKDRAPGSGVLLHLHEGLALTLGDLVYLMIAISDNTATNVLIERVGMQRVNEVMQALGMQHSTLERPMRGHASAAGAAENWATPDDYARIMAALLDGTASGPHRRGSHCRVPIAPCAMGARARAMGTRAMRDESPASRASCLAMTAYLEKQQNERRIARFLPKNDRPRWGSKTGSVAGVVNDVGFIETARGPLILSIFCETDDPWFGEQVIGEISRAAWQAAG